MQLGCYKALTFDVYGTLIDWETGMVNSLKPLTDKVSTHNTGTVWKRTRITNHSSAQTPGKSTRSC